MCPFLLVCNKFFAHARMDSTIKLNILNQQKDEGTVGIDGELGTWALVPHFTLSVAHPGASSLTTLVKIT